MKNVLSLILSILLILSVLSACADAGAPGSTGTADTQTQPVFNPNAPLSDGRTLKVLAIGNSFSNNTTQYLYDIATAEGITEVVIGRLYISGCTLAKHLENSQTNASAYTYYKNDSGTWNSIEAATLLYALHDEDWDIITMQQGSGSFGKVETYRGVIDQLVNYVNKTNPNARLVWHMTWAYQEGSTNAAFVGYENDQLTMYNAIVNAVQQGIDITSHFAAVIPVGTAIQNARTSFMGDNLTRDTYHLNEMGMVIGGYTWYSVLTGKTLDSISLRQVTNALTLTDQDKTVIMESVNNAVAAPYAITQSAYMEG